MPQDQVRQVTLNVDLGYAKSILGICKVLEFVSCQSILSQGFPLKIWDGGGGVSQWYAWAFPLTQIAKVIWEGMPMSLGFWEWGMSKRGNAYVTVTGAPLQFLTKKPLPPPPSPPWSHCPRGDHNWRIIKRKNNVEIGRNKKLKYGIPSTTVLCCLLNL